jgi:hypothetical protein
MIRAIDRCHQQFRRHPTSWSNCISNAKTIRTSPIVLNRVSDLWRASISIARFAVTYEKQYVEIKMVAMWTSKVKKSCSLQSTARKLTRVGKPFCTNDWIMITSHVRERSAKRGGNSSYIFHVYILENKTIQFIFYSYSGCLNWELDAFNICCCRETQRQKAYILYLIRPSLFFQTLFRPTLARGTAFTAYLWNSYFCSHVHYIIQLDLFHVT